MRVEYRFELSALETPRFSVEAVEGIGKLFTLATLVLNVLETRREVDLVFHGLNPEDPQRKITAGAASLLFIAGGARGQDHGPACATRPPNRRSRTRYSASAFSSAARSKSGQ